MISNWHKHLIMGLLVCIFAIPPAWSQEEKAPPKEEPKEAEQAAEAKPAKAKPEEKANKPKETEASKQETAKTDSAKQKSSEEPAVESKMRLAVLTLGHAQVSEGFAETTAETVRKAFTELGLYDVMPLDVMRANMESLKKNLPAKCEETACLLKSGKLLNLAKAVGGEISQNGNDYAVKLNMVDIATGKSEGMVWLASDCREEELPILVKAAVLRLHAQLPESLSIQVKLYRGPEFAKHAFWGVTAGATLAAGVAFAMIDGGMTGRDANSTELDGGDYSESTAASSGIPAAFLNLGYGARAHALGNSYVAVSNDASGMLWNPAGLARMKTSEANASYLKTVAGITYLNAGYAARFSRTGAYGAALLTNGDDVYRETEFVSSCAKTFDAIHPNLRPFSLGMSLKLRTASTGKGTVGNNAATGNSFGVSIDAGCQFELADHIQMGLVARDLVSPQKWHNTLANTNYAESVPTTLILGGAFQATPTLLLVMDGHIPAFADQYYKLGMGAEKILFDVLAVRGGLFQNLDFVENRRYMGGFGLSYKGMGCDASYEFAQEKVFQGNTRISTSWQF